VIWGIGLVSITVLEAAVIATAVIWQIFVVSNDEQYALSPEYLAYQGHGLVEKPVNKGYKQISLSRYKKNGAA
jgi:hypothetical protein